MPSGRLCAACAANATSLMPIARSGDPFTLKLPFANSRSSSATSSWWATIWRALSTIFSPACQTRDAADGERAAPVRVHARAARPRCRRAAPRRRPRSTPSWSATICANVVSWLWPCGEVPMTDLHGAERLEADRRAVPASDRVADRAEDARRSEAAHLVVRREPDPDLLRVAARTARLLLGPDRVEVEDLEQPVERRVVVARVEREPRGHRVRELLDEVPPAKLDRVDPELGRERVHRPLEDVRRLRPPGPAVRVGRRRVREDAGERDAVVRDLVRARVEPRAEQRDPGRDELEVRAHRARHLALDGRDLPVASSPPNVSSVTTSRPWIVAW